MLLRIDLLNINHRRCTRFRKLAISILRYIDDITSENFLKKSRLLIENYSLYQLHLQCLEKIFILVYDCGVKKNHYCLPE